MAPVNGHRRVLEDRYELGEVVGRGGMAEVRAGWDHRLGREVAVKLLHSDRARDVYAQARFRREALSAAALNHPAIVAVYDSGEEFVDEVTGAIGPTLYIVMELVRGRSLDGMLKSGPPDLGTALEVTAGVLSALEYSHAKGIVHRDIKPGNVMITEAGAVKVMDFGIARAMADATSRITETLSVVGTAEYLSPEQARGENVDTRSDLYSTGCLLYELLTGRPPFIGDSAVSVAYQHVRERPEPPSALNPSVPKDVDRVVLRALAKNRGNRYQTAEEFRRELEAALDRPASAAPPSVLPLPDGPEAPATRAQLRQDRTDPVQRRRTLAYSTAVVAALIVGALVVWLLPRGDRPTEAATPRISTTPTPSALSTPTTSLPAVPSSPTGSAPAASTSATASTSRPATSTPTSRVAVTPSVSRSVTTAPASFRPSPTVPVAGWSGPCFGTVELTNSWTGAYQAHISIRNGAGSPVPDPWTAVVALPAGQTLSNGWDATVSGVGTGTVAASPYSPGPLAAGGTSAFMIQVNAAQPVLPTAFTINGVACTTG